VIKAVYPILLGPNWAPRSHPDESSLGEPTRVIPHVGTAGVVQAFDIETLVDLATEAECTIEVVPQVGDSVTRGDPVFRLYGGTMIDPTMIDTGELLQHIALERERTLEQDPAFAFRVIVDIASKALSPAINDPTTAVLALDQIHNLLRDVGIRRLDTGLVHDSKGRLRLIYRTPDWHDFVGLAVTEIRQFGANSTQVVRRLRAMLENLIPLLPPDRSAVLRQELELLKSTVDLGFAMLADRERADLPDFQGLGGARRSYPSK